MGQWRARLALAATAALAVAAAPTGDATAGPGAGPVSCAGLASALNLANTTVTGAAANATSAFTIPASQPGGGTPITGLPPFCDVTLTQTNPPASDRIHVEVWLPLTGGNGRLQAVGGGGYSCGISYSAMAPALESGYATVSTDCGHPPAQDDGSFALNANGSLNWPLIDDFAYRGIHEMTVDAKAVMTAYDGSAPAYSYFNGCSTGGREGLMEAQRYPGDYSGILSGSPAVNWDELMIAQLWGEFAMEQLGDYLPQCKFTAFQLAAVQACETYHGVNYGEIMNPAGCGFNPYSLVGRSTPCGPITKADARVVQLVLRGETSGFPGGRPLWYGLEPGTDFAGLAGTATADGVTGPSPFPIAVAWLRYWLTRNPDFNWQTITVRQLDQFFVRSTTEFAVMDTSNPDLTAFRDAGGKILIWTGLADQLIYPQGVVRYYGNVIGAAGGLAAAQSFARLFLAPGNGHCGNDSYGPVAAGQFSALTTWVENGTAPATLLATTAGSSAAAAETRPLCAYPDQAVYNGTGSIDRAASFHCGPGLPRPPGGD
jgi:Tannase and feruloyl esterase